LADLEVGGVREGLAVDPPLVGHHVAGQVDGQRALGRLLRESHRLRRLQVSVGEQPAVQFRRFGVDRRGG
jgi:hypothetical protein